MMTKNRTPLLLILAAVFALPATGASAQIDPRFVLTGDAAANIGETNMINSVTAEAIGKACLRMATELHEDAAVVILDNFGKVAYQNRTDGAATRTTVDTAEFNARTAYLTRRPSKIRLNAVVREPGLQVRDIGRGFYAEAGGLPIWVGNQIIGFIGVGNMGRRRLADGSLNWSDEICGYRAIMEVIGSQPPLDEDLPGS